MLKRNKLLDWIGGSQEDVEFRRRLFNVLQFLSGAISFGSLIFNSYMGFIDEMIGFSLMCIVSTSLLWSAGRFSTLPLQSLGFFTALLAFPLFGGSWFLFGGSGGMTPPLLFWMICLVFIFENRKVQILVLISVLLFGVALFVAEAMYPALINPYYPDDEARYTDVAITYTLALTGYCVLVFSMTWLHSDTMKRLQDEQQLRAELEKQSIKERAREREERLELLQRMSRGLAHDLNNLLMVISTSAEMLDESIFDNDASKDEIKTDLKAVIDTAGAASRLTRRLLDSSLSRERAQEALSVSHFLTNLAPILSRISQDVAVHLVLDNHPAMVMIHRSELEQVVMNLALNSIQAMNHRGDLFLRCRVQDGLILLEVEDNGSGIDAEHLDQIFEPLFTTKLELGGTGLGLSTVRSIIHRYNGGISVSSTVGNGTCFSISIPLSPEPAGGRAARSTQRSLLH